MSTTVTRQDLKAQVVAAIEAYGTVVASRVDYDIDAIASVLASRDVTDVDTLDHDEFWALAGDHLTEQAPEFATVEQVEAGLRERDIPHVEVALDFNDNLWVWMHPGDGRVVCLGGERRGWTFTVYGDPALDEVVTTDGVEGTGPDALAQVLDTIAFHLGGDR